MLDLAGGGLNFTSGHTEMNPEAFRPWVGSHRFSGLGRRLELGLLSRMSLSLLLPGEDIAGEGKGDTQAAGEDIGICQQGVEAFTQWSLYAWLGAGDSQENLW